MSISRGRRQRRSSTRAEGNACSKYGTSKASHDRATRRPSHAQGRPPTTGRRVFLTLCLGLCLGLGGGSTTGVGTSSGLSRGSSSLSRPCLSVCLPLGVGSLHGLSEGTMKPHSPAMNLRQASRPSAALRASTTGALGPPLLPFSCSLPLLLPFPSASPLPLPFPSGVGAFPLPWNSGSCGPSVQFAGSRHPPGFNQKGHC